MTQMMRWSDVTTSGFALTRCDVWVRAVDGILVSPASARRHKISPNVTHPELSRQSLSFRNQTNHDNNYKVECSIEHDLTSKNIPKSQTKQRNAAIHALHLHNKAAIVTQKATHKEKSQSLWEL